MEYVIEDGRFDATFGFAGNIDPDELISDRRKRVLRARFGDKPVVYPSPPEGEGWELQPQQ